MKKSESIELLAAALVGVQGDVEAIPKDSTNPFFKSSYADLPTVIKVAGPIITKHGISVSQLTDFDGTHDLLTTLVMHTSGQWLESSMRLHLVKDDPQGQGSAITYARRYSYMAALGLVADEDDDGNAASKQQAKKKAQPKPASSPQPPVVPAGMVGAAEAMHRLLEAYSGDKGAAAAAWGERSKHDPIPEQDLNFLLAEAAPFEEANQ